MICQSHHQPANFCYTFVIGAGGELISLILLLFFFAINMSSRDITQGFAEVSPAWTLDGVVFVSILPLESQCSMGIQV